MNELLSKTLTVPLNFGSEYDKKQLINTINAHSYNVAQKDEEFYKALMQSDILIPDGVGALFAFRLLKKQKIKKISAYDLFEYELKQLSLKKGKCFFLGSSENTLSLIRERIKIDYPDVIVKTHSPPFKPVFDEEDNKEMISVVNEFSPDVLFVGMTAPKQEKWTAVNFDRLDTKHACCIGAVFDFYAGTIRRAPKWMIDLGLEWFFRLVREPRRMWRRYVYGNPKFIFKMLREKFSPATQ